MTDRYVNSIVPHRTGTKSVRDAVKSGKPVTVKNKETDNRYTIPDNPKCWQIPIAGSFQFEIHFASMEDF